MKLCRECGKPFEATHGHQAICSDPCRRARANRKTKAWEQANADHCRDVDRAYEQTHRDRRNELHRQYRAEDPQHYRRKSRENHRRHKEAERAQYKLWQEANRRKRTLYMIDWERRNNAIRWAKESPETVRAFVLVRTRPVDGQASFWRGVLVGKAIAANEQIVARYIQCDDGRYVVHMPHIVERGLDARRIVETLNKRETRPKAHRRPAASK